MSMESFRAVVVQETVEEGQGINLHVGTTVLVADGCEIHFEGKR